MKKLISAILVIATLISMLAVSSTMVSADSTDGLPDVVDLSQSKFFPPIKSQGDQGSCVAWAQAYYQFTYEMNKALDRESTAENLFSPSFVYNMSNYGEDTGSFPKTAFNNMKKIGVATWNTIPYNKEVHRDWFPQESIWQEAAKYRIADFKILPDFRTGSGKHVEHPDDPDLTQIKTLLSEGHVLTFGAFLYRWKKSTLKSNPACPANDPYVGEDVVIATSPDIGTGYGHRMTLVGYNDNIWVDINGNKNIDKGEMGAFKVANSFGTWWGNDGYIWIAYDNINMTTSVEGGLPYNTMSGVVEVSTITVLPYNSDADIYIRYTLNTADRQHMTATIIAEKDGKTYEVIAGPHHEAPYAKNIYSLDGTENSTDGTLIFMLSNVVPGITSETLGDYKWSVKFEDTKANSKALTVKNVEIVDLSTNRVAKPLEPLGFTLEGSAKTLTFGDIAPYVPPATTTPVTTTAPITTEAETTILETASQPITTEPVKTTTVPATETEPTETTTEVFTETTVITEPVETTTEIFVTTTVTPTETTIVLPTETTKAETEPTETTKEDVVTTNAPEVQEFVYGDANGDNNIKINDATLVQKFVAFLVDADSLNQKNADCNSDSKVSVKDATCIQKYLAKLSGFANVGEKYTVEVTYPTEFTEFTTTIPETVTTTPETTVIITEPTEEVTTTAVTEPTEAITTTATQPENSTVIETEPTEATTETVITTETTVITTEATEPTTETPTEEPTEPSTPPVTDPVVKNIVTFTNSFSWQGEIRCYYWSDNNKTMTVWPGVPMENAGQNDFGETLYTLEIPQDATYIIFTNGSIQTVDIPYIGGEQKFYPVAPDSGGKYTVQNW